MGRIPTEEQLPCVCGKGMVTVQREENDHSWLRESNSWSRVVAIEPCPECGKKEWRPPTEAESKADKEETDALWAGLIERSKNLKK